MTIESYYTPQTSNINGPQEYPFTFEFIGLDRIFVYELDAAGDPTQVDPSDYSLVPGGSAPLYDGGQINFNRAHGAGVTQVRIERRTEPLQEVVYSTYYSFPSKVVELTLDKLTMLVQELSDTTQDGVVEEAPFNSKLYGRYNGAWVEVTGAGGGGGEINTAANLPGDEGIFFQKSGVELQFKSLVAGTGITLESDDDSITINNSGSGGGAFLPLDGSEDMEGSIIMANGAPELQFKQGLSSGLTWGATGSNAEFKRVLGVVDPILRMWEKDGEAIQLAVGNPALANWVFKETGKNSLIAMQTAEVSMLEWVNFGTDTLVSTIGRNILGELRVQNTGGSKTILNAGNTTGVTVNLDATVDELEVVGADIEIDGNKSLKWDGENASIGVNANILSVFGEYSRLGSATYGVTASDIGTAVTIDSGNTVVLTSANGFNINGGDINPGSGVDINMHSGVGREINFGGGAHKMEYAGVPGGINGLKLISNGSLIQLSNTGVWVTGQINAQNDINAGANDVYCNDLRYSGSLIPTSDRAKKDNIRDLEYGLGDIEALRSVAFTFKDDEQQAPRMGFIAQEVEPILPELVHIDKHGVWGMDYVSLIPVLVNAVQELSGRLAALEA